MIKSWVREIELAIQARSGASPALFVCLAIAVMATLTAFAFLCVAGYDWFAIQFGRVFAALLMTAIFVVIAIIAAMICAAARQRARDRAILERAARAHARSSLLDPKLLTLAQALNERVPFAATFMISAQSGDGVGDLKSYFAAHVPAGLWLYPEDQISEAPLRQLAAEITREKLYLRLHQELPYQSTVETEVWKELKHGAVRIEQTVYVERESQRKIVLGKAGQTIKAIGAAARAEIAAAIERPVHLFLFVKVREGWGDDPERYREMGLEFPKE